MAVYNDQRWSILGCLLRVWLYTTIRYGGGAGV
jgi:hypothetical protein